ncbi:hypothetical protein BMS3Abin16_00921 [archaeon BMS3Abin16]|nr:hypothetical protein BMS3Abin16_00921 [archaeon BMS3Abin16]
MKERITDKPWLFVLDRNEIRGIVTIGDFRKAPVRMFLFALVNLLEMHFTSLIRKRCKEDELKELIRDRLGSATKQQRLRKEKNEALDIFECLQFCDKRDILQKKPDILERLISDSEKETSEILEKAENLRDRLAHGNDIVAGTTWKDIINLTEYMEKIISKCEQINQQQTKES